MGVTTQNSLGYGQTWQAVTRTSGTTYYNTTSRPIFGNVYGTTASGGDAISISINGAAAVTLWTGSGIANAANFAAYIVPPGASYVITMANGQLPAVEFR